MSFIFVCILYILLCRDKLRQWKVGGVATHGSNLTYKRPSFTPPLCFFATLNYLTEKQANCRPLQTAYLHFFWPWQGLESKYYYFRFWPLFMPSLNIHKQILSRTETINSSEAQLLFMLKGLEPVQRKWKFFIIRNNISYIVLINITS